ncbi:MAG: SNF2-related protein, partial [Campylobacterota bacterium]|nr:SNF2-related protein [Campylobacterota bacterium]
EELKILVGINIDNATFKSIENSKLIKEEFSKEQILLFNKDSNSNKYLNIDILSKMLLTQKIKMKIYNTNNLHAKIYILRDDIKEQRTGLKYNGSVITGSSNLTHSGLSSDGNIEINVELKDNDDIKFAYEIFMDIWDNQSREFTKEDVDNYIIPFIKIDNIDKNKNTLTTFQVYIKLLIEHFGNRINFINSDDIFVPDGYKQLSYQVEAVNDGIDKLDKHNGFFLSDVVGLGKTVVTAMLCKKLEPLLIKKILIVIPPAIKSQWMDTFDTFEIKNYDIISFSSLDKIDSSKYKLIIVDESHKFKNIKTKRYEKLAKICKDKKVILLSATPQNNSPKDLHSQLNLFQNMKNSTISTCENLDRFFNTLNSEYQDIINSDDGNIDKKSLENISIQIRDKVLRNIMIRRTRTDIEAHSMYMSELINQGLTIPEVKPLKEHEYEMKEPLNSIFEKTANILVDKLKYERFNTLAYLTTKARETYYPNESDNIFEHNALSTLMRNLLIKRFESSFYAFNISINRQLIKYQEFIKNFKNDKIYLGKKASDILNYDETINSDYDKFIEKLIEKGDIKILSQNDFKYGYLEKLEADLLVLEDLVELWRDNKDDPKVDKFIDEIVSQDLTNHIEKKIVVFTESKDTSKYLETKLPNNDKILF